MRSVVTGGSGFIGSNLVDALVARGDEVTVIDDLSTGRRENLEGALGAGAELVEADVREAEAMTALAQERKPELIFHLAAQIDVRRSVADPAFDASINVGGTANLLEAARAGGAQRFVFVSTGGAIYGEGEGKRLPLGEDAAEEPVAPYGQSKLAGEGYVSLYRRLYGLSGVNLRLGNVYGPRQERLDHVAHVHVVAGLGSVAEHGRRLRGAQPAAEDRDHARLTERVLAGPVDVAETQVDAREPVEASI